MVVDQVAKVVDWGLAKTTNDETGLTKTGMLVGTPTYMAPEQVMGQQTGAYTDFYALGVMLYELCAKKPPFEGSITEVLSGKLKGSAPSLALCGRALPEDMIFIVNSLLERDMSKRPQKVQDVLQTLRSIQNGLLSRSPLSTAKTQNVAVQSSRRRNETLMAASVHHQGPSQEKKRGPFFFVTLILLGVLLGALSIVFFHGSSSLVLPPLVSSVRLADFDKVILSLSRQPDSAKVTLSFSSIDGQTRLHRKLTKEIVQTKKPSLTIPVQLNVWFFEPAKLTLQVEDNGLSYRQTFLLSPKDLLADLWDPIDRLEGETLESLIKDVVKMKARLQTMREKKIPEEERLPQIALSLRQRLLSEGFTKEYCRKLEKTLPKLLKGSSYAGSELDRRLLPLRHIERALTDYICPELPWKFCITKRLGFTYGEGLLPKQGNGWRPLWSTQFKNRATNPKSPEPNHPKWYTYLWLDEWSKVHKYQSYALASEGAFQSAVTAIIQMDLLEPDEVRPNADSLKVEEVIRARFKIPSRAAWPPKEALIGFSIKLFGPEAVISLRINDSPTIILTNAGNHENDTRYPADKNTWLTLPISSNWLQRDLNSIYFEPIRAPGPDKLIPICLKECKLWIR